MTASASSLTGPSKARVRRRIAVYHLRRVSLCTRTAIGVVVASNCWVVMTDELRLVAIELVVYMLQ
jgi:hypothetical protein